MPSERAAARAEIWRLVALLWSLGTIAIIATGYQGIAALALVLGFIASERYRWWVDRKWEAIAWERAEREVISTMRKDMGLPAAVPGEGCPRCGCVHEDTPVPGATGILDTTLVNDDGEHRS